jgi:hypothetical protein
MKTAPADAKRQSFCGQADLSVLMACRSMALFDRKRASMAMTAFYPLTI